MNKLEVKERKHTWHWSSTEGSSTRAWYQNFNNGIQNDYYVRTSCYWVRAVRKVKKWTSSKPKKRNTSGTGRVLRTVLRERGISPSTMAASTTSSRLMVTGRERWEGWRFLDKTPNPNLQNGAEFLSIINSPISLLKSLLDKGHFLIANNLCCVCFGPPSEGFFLKQ